MSTYSFSQFIGNPHLSSSLRHRFTFKMQFIYLPINLLVAFNVIWYDYFPGGLTVPVLSDKIESHPKMQFTILPINLFSRFQCNLVRLFPRWRRSRSFKIGAGSADRFSKKSRRVIHPVLQHGDPLHAHTEGEPGGPARGHNPPSPAPLDAPDPSPSISNHPVWEQVAASLSAAHHARHVDLGGGLGEGEKTRARSLISRSWPNIWRANASRVPFRSPRLI